MLPIMQLLCFEYSLHLIRHRVVRVVSEIRRDLVRGGKHRGASPPRNIQHFLIDSLLGHLNRVNGSHYRFVSPLDREASLVAFHLYGQAAQRQPSL